ncbi:MAG: MAPEG family protein [SAR86 cluster bacterium]|uniref:MAPEG family protein n=1 Tax=SAR86 cluster bacterium TaxID=2030880 RepID=A0A838XV80_9GAMM|nr:MAPEG family protein [SAR86 cluster bacterium]
MATYIVYALLLTIIQIWIVPAALNMKNFSWYTTNRDEPMPETSVMAGRAIRAATNLQESLPAFLALALLSMHLSIDLTGLAFWWLILRVVHLVTYIAGIALLRTLSWLGSLVTLIMMALALV